jgi:uncharacterized membrane protein
VNTGVLVVVAVLAYTVFATCNARSGGRIDASLSSFIFNGLAAVVSLGVYFAQVYLSGARHTPTRPSGIGYSVVAGAAIGVFSIVLITIYGRGGQLSYVFPLVYGAAIALGAVVGFLALGEPVSTVRVVGVAAIVLGIALLASA